MKRFLLISSLFLFFVSCNHEKNKPLNKEVVICGKLNDNKDREELYLIYSQPGTKSFDIPLKLDSLGHFKTTLKSAIPLDAMILDRKNSASFHFIYHPSDSIYIEFTPKKNRIEEIKTVRFKADRSKTNNLLVDFQVAREENKLGYDVYNLFENSKNNLDAFIKKTDSIKTAQLNLFNEFKKKHSLNSEEERWMKDFVLETYYYYRDMCGYFKEEFGIKNIPAGYFDYNKDVENISFPNDIISQELRTRIMRRFMYYMSQKESAFIKKYADILDDIKDYKVNSDSLVIDYFKKNISNNDLLQLFIAEYYSGQFRNKLIQGYKDNQELLKKTITFETIKNNLDDYYKEVEDFVNKPNVYTNEVLTSMKNTPIEKTFTEILSKNKGKVIYMDVWATYCQPCIESMPHSKKLMEKFKGKNVEFVYICIDSQEEIWKKWVSKFNLGGGQHYFLDRKQSRFFRNSLNIQGIPQSFIIDKQGVIVEKGKNIHSEHAITEKKISALLKK
ncbi:MAG: TlpA family protein disulfide reductase [Flavobacteriaceae bacterium]|nr:TlpA family protein disulfide reductase [Flavobacteriaceae bacterium]